MHTHVIWRGSSRNLSLVQIIKNVSDVFGCVEVVSLVLLIKSRTNWWCGFWRCQGSCASQRWDAKRGWSWEFRFRRRLLGIVSVPFVEKGLIIFFPFLLKKIPMSPNGRRLEESILTVEKFRDGTAKGMWKTEKQKQKNKLHGMHVHDTSAMYITPRSERTQWDVLCATWRDMNVMYTVVVCIVKGTEFFPNHHHENKKNSNTGSAQKKSTEGEHPHDSLSTCQQCAYRGVNVPKGLEKLVSPHLQCVTSWDNLYWIWCRMMLAARAKSNWGVH